MRELAALDTEMEEMGDPGSKRVARNSITNV